MTFQLKTKNISLIPFDENRHFERYFDLRNDVRILHLWSGRRNIVTRWQLEDELRGDLTNLRHMFLSLLSNKTGDILGFVFDYGFNPASGITYTSTIIDPNLIGTGYGIHAMALFIPYLFDYFNIRKIYAEVYEYNHHMIKILEKSGYKEESRLVDHVFFNSKFHSLLIYSLNRDDDRKVRNIYSRIACKAQ